MKYFRINIYLNFKNFLKAIFFFSNETKYERDINKAISKNSNKKNISLTSQCRISFLFLLRYLKKKFPKKNEIIFCAYNLPEMINVASNLDFKIIFCDLYYKTGFYNLNKLKRKINKKTAAVVLTNMFNSYEQSLQLKKICKKRHTLLIEDNAIYFDNHKIKKNKKIFSGTIGDFSIYSFNIMKNISALYGGAVASNFDDFHLYLNKESIKLKSFNKILLFKQIIIFFILKIMSVKFLYKYFFFNIIKKSHINNIHPLMKLFYPSLKFKIVKFPKHYFTNISSFSKKLIFNQLTQSKIRMDSHKKRKIKNIYYYQKFNKYRINQIKIIKISDFNYQNFIDFPLLVKNKIKLNHFLLKNGIETRFHYYQNCERIFVKSGKLSCSNSEKYEKQIICLPNHEKISLKYIDYIIKMISFFYSNNIKKNSN